MSLKYITTIHIDSIPSRQLLIALPVVSLSGLTQMKNTQSNENIYVAMFMLTPWYMTPFFRSQTL